MPKSALAMEAVRPNGGLVSGFFRRGYQLGWPRLSGVGRTYGRGVNPREMVRMLNTQHDVCQLPRARFRHFLIPRSHLNW